MTRINRQNVHFHLKQIVAFREDIQERNLYTTTPLKFNQVLMLLFVVGLFVIKGLYASTLEVKHGPRGQRHFVFQHNLFCAVYELTIRQHI